MRAILIFANILLAGLIALGASQWLGEPDVNAEIATSVTKERKSSTPQPKNIQQQQQMMQQQFMQQQQMMGQQPPQNNQ